MAYDGMIDGELFFSNKSPLTVYKFQSPQKLASAVVLVFMVRSLDRQR